MSIIIKKFDTYGVKYSSPMVSGVTKAWASIACYDFHVEVGYIVFPDSYPLPANLYTNNKIKIHFHISRFNDIIGILRYEKPLHFYFDESKKEGWIGTVSHEPIGEQEPV
jgi:hypothetical protein